MVVFGSDIGKPPAFLTLTGVLEHVKSENINFHDYNGDCVGSSVSSLVMNFNIYSSTCEKNSSVVDFITLRVSDR